MPPDRPGHDWTDCKPVMLSVAYEHPQPYTHEEVDAAVQAVWAGLNPEAREAFHRFCCENEHTPGTIAVMSSFSRQLRRRLPMLQ